MDYFREVNEVVASNCRKLTHIDTDICLIERGLIRNIQVYNTIKLNATGDGIPCKVALTVVDGVFERHFFVMFQAVSI